MQEALRRAAETTPCRNITYVQADGSELVQTYRELREDAEHILGGLRSLGLGPGEKVIFQLDWNQDFIAAFWGCMLGGFVPAPISIPTTYRELNSTITKLHHSWEMLEHPIILTRDGLVDDIRNVRELLGLQSFRVKSIEVLRSSPRDPEWHESQPDDTCLMLLTSGSTGLPKGVLQSHRSLLSRSAATAQFNHFDQSDIFLNWFPLDHVGGIVMSHLMALFVCAGQVHAPTELILQEPLKWLDLIEKHHATYTWAPNFAFALINDREKEITTGSWDLSSMRFVLNGGEAIVARTARKFLHLLAKHGLRDDSMHPSWGMSETCSGVTFSERCSLETITDEQSFVEVGAPIRGVAIRIVDDQDRPREEGQIGRLQITGLPVTTGYYKNPELSRESFSSDGWFNTGDLGVLREGRLSITGRAKDVIIINGLNFYCHEVEAVVEEVEGVDVSFTAACPVRVGEQDTDQMAIFFHTRETSWPDMLKVMKAIRENVVRKTGVNPDFVIPLDEQEIPKTAIGKIQRSKLRQRFEAGEFQQLLKQIDLETANANTLPTWFHEEIWLRRERAVGYEGPVNGTYLVFVDELGTGDSVCRQLRGSGLRCVLVRKRPDFERLGPEEYGLNPGAVSDYQQLVDTLHANEVQFDHVLHFWSYGDAEGSSNAALLRAAQDCGTHSVFALLRALANVQNVPSDVRLFVITNNAQITSMSEKLTRSEAAAVGGLLLTAELELPWLECRHVDLGMDSLKANAECVLRELKLNTKRPKVAYRGSRRFEAFLCNVNMFQKPMKTSPIEQDGLYLVTGGLGGVGVELSRHLIRGYRTKLLLVGRTPISNELPANDLAAQRAENYTRLREMSRAVRYEALDIADVDAVRRFIADAELHYNQRLAGVFHLAGSLGPSQTLRRHWDEADKHLIANETLDSFEDIFQAKVYGTWVLFEALRDRPDTLFVGFSSLNALFGGSTFAAYSAANAFLRTYCLHKRLTSHPQTFCFDWPMWDDLGMSEGSPEDTRELSREMGFQIIRKEQGINSLLAGLCRDHGQLVIALDASNPRLSGRLHSEAKRLTQVTAVVDTQRFIGREQNADEGEVGIVQACSDTERRLETVWKEVLNLPRIVTTESFFELGGDSLAAMRLVNKVREAFGVVCPIRALFENPTVRKLARVIEQRVVDETNRSTGSARKDRPVTAEELLDRIDQIPDSEVEALLQEITGNEFPQ
jgi:acyl-CoA synthetase (AMP-forming)/AMP-acid ligase II/NAD(P)-dependent dehydrogenase (short-subunit alcohol dehydrogenase family)/acyl carrier protein